MVPRKTFTLMLALLAMAAGLAGCAEPEEAGNDGIDTDPGAGDAPFDDTDDSLASDDENLGDDPGAADGGDANQSGEMNETGETNETGDANETGETNETPA